MLQSSRLKYHMNNINIDKSVRNRASFEHKFLNNMKNIYQHAGKCADPQKNDILGDTMVSTPEEITYYSPILPMNQTKIKKTSARKSLRLFTNIFGVKKGTDIRHDGAAKSKCRAIKYGCGL